MLDNKKDKAATKAAGYYGRPRTHKCLHCGKERQRDFPCEVSLRKFCSLDCAHAHMRHPRKLLACKTCGRKFMSAMKNGRFKELCSAACRGISQRRREPKNCKTCGKAIISRLSMPRKYCSLKCHFDASWKVFTCPQCGMTFRTVKSNRKRGRAFCSRSCFYGYYKGERNRLWRGVEAYFTTPEWASIAEQIRERDGHKCLACGIPQKKGQRLCVDHIIPYRLTWKHDDVNLLSLCKPCHFKKTHAERCVLVGDRLGFIEKLKLMNYPMDRVEAALTHWGNTTPGLYPNAVYWRRDDKGRYAKREPNEVCA